MFGPATRSLPKLPIDVEIGSDGRQYFVARSDFHEPIGPAFWERSCQHRTTGPPQFRAAHAAGQGREILR